MGGLLKFITCGSVDDGKSTLIGHLLYDAKLIFADQKNALILDSKIGSRGGEIDYSLLLDGLMAEREQGITIDVAYRYFNTDKRSFIVADTPGHEEYTRNMAVGASFAELALILIDASKGIQIQTRRHIRICTMMGIRHLVFVVNKMDLVDYSEQCFRKTEQEVNRLVAEFKCDSVCVIPVSATEGDNVVKPSENMKWYEGKTVLAYLEEIDVAVDETSDDFIMPVQRVCRPHANFRGFQGQPVSGKTKVGDEILVLPSAEKANIKEILVTDKKSEELCKGQAATVVLDREMDVSRGCVLTGNKNLTISRLFQAELLWMDDSKLVAGREYLLKIGTKTIAATVIKINYCVDINTGNHILAKDITKNDIVNCDIGLSEKVVLSAFDECRQLGRFILVNRISNMTSACGIIRHSLRRSDNLTYQALDITRDIRANQKNQKPYTLWFTGLSGAGKSTIVNELEKMLVTMGRHTMVLDGDNVRLGLNGDLGFAVEDRVENIRRIAEVAKLMNDAGLIVLVAAISPFASDRENARKIVGSAFKEIYVSTSLEECEKRDVKQLYKKAREGKIPNFTGISSPYEVPEDAEFVADTMKNSVQQLAQKIMEKFNL